MKQIPAFLFITVIVCSACSKPKSFEYRNIKNIKIGSVNSSKANVTMDLVYFNPNSYGVSLKKVDCDIYLDSSYAGKFLLDTLMYIQPKTEFTLPANLDVDVGNLLSGGLMALLNKEVLIGAKGKAKVGKGGIYVNVPFSYEAKQKLNFF